MNDAPCTSDKPCTTITFKAGESSQKVVFDAPIVSGTHSFTASCDQCSNTASTQVSVKVDNLQPIPASEFYVVGGATTIHPGNFYLTPQAANKLLVLAINYQSQSRFKVLNSVTGKLVYPEKLRINEASLITGGIFDSGGNWTGPHFEHQRGTAVDLRANNGTPNTIPEENFDEFQKLLDWALIPKKGEESFLECTKDKKDAKGNLIGPVHNRIKENNCVSQLDGSQDSNRHFHVRLRGVKE